jgi:hypothetical protein
MDELQFDSLFQQPFGRQDVIQTDARLRRCIVLGITLWGRTSDDPRRQLLTSYPEIPSGFDLEDLRELQRSAQIISQNSGDPRNVWLSRLAISSATIFVGTQRFRAWEARCNIVRRAIEYLEKTLKLPGPAG